MLNMPTHREKWEHKRQWYEGNGYADQLLISRDEPDGSIDPETIERPVREQILLEQRAAAPAPFQIERTIFMSDRLNNYELAKNNSETI